MLFETSFHLKINWLEFLLFSLEYLLQTFLLLFLSQSGGFFNLLELLQLHLSWINVRLKIWIQAITKAKVIYCLTHWALSLPWWYLQTVVSIWWLLGTLTIGGSLHGACHIISSWLLPSYSSLRWCSYSFSWQLRYEEVWLSLRLRRRWKGLELYLKMVHGHLCSGLLHLWLNFQAY
jgi:hypothetical protein